MSSGSLKRKSDNAPSTTDVALECSVCNERFDSTSRIPLPLSCGHQFCYQCVIALAGRAHCITCPACQAETSFVRGLESLLTASQTVDMKTPSTLSLSSSSLSPVIAAHCELCDELHAASHYCCECEQSMCQALVGVHRRMKGTATHCLEPIGDSIDQDSSQELATSMAAFCADDQHTSAIEYFDFNCSCFLCSKCVLNHAQDHSRLIKLLAEAAPLCRSGLDTLSARFAQWHSRIESTVTDCQERSAAVLAEESRLLSEVEQACKQIQDAAEARCGELMTHFHHSFQSKANQMATHVEKWMNLNARLRAQRKKLISVLADAQSMSDLSCALAYKDFFATLPQELRAVPPLVARSAAAVLETPIVLLQPPAALDSESISGALAAMSQIGFSLVPSHVELSQVADDDGDLHDARVDKEVRPEQNDEPARFTNFKEDKEGARSASIHTVQHTPDGKYFVAVQVRPGLSANQLHVYRARDDKLMFSFGAQQLEAGCRCAVGAITTDHHVIFSVTGKKDHCLLVFKLEIVLRRCTFVRQIGTKGRGAAHLNGPLDLAVTKHGLVLVADSLNHRVQVFRLSDGAHVRAFGSHGASEREFDTPTSVSLSADEQHVYVCDSMNHRIQKFDRDWNLVHSLGKFGRDEAQFNQPLCAVVASDGRIMVADSGNNRIQFFNLELEHVDSFFVTTLTRHRPVFLTLSPSGQLFAKYHGMTDWSIWDTKRMNSSCFDAEQGESNQGSTNLSELPSVPAAGAFPEIAHNSMKDAYENQNPKNAIDSLQFLTSELSEYFVAVKRCMHGTQKQYQLAVCNTHDNSTRFEFGAEQVKDSKIVCGAVTADQRAVISMSGKNEHCLLVYKLAAGGAEFVRQIGAKGKGAEKLSEPGGLAVSKAGLVFVADSMNHRVQVYRLSDGAHVRSIGSHGDGVLHFNEPKNVCLSIDERYVFVSDSQNHRIQQLTIDGGWVKTLGGYGKGAGSFDNPQFVVAAPSHRLVVCDTGNRRVQVFDEKLEFVRSMRMQTQGGRCYINPVYLALSSSLSLHVKCKSVNEWLIWKI